MYVLLYYKSSLEIVCFQVALARLPAENYPANKRHRVTMYYK